MIHRLLYLILLLGTMCQAGIAQGKVHDFTLKDTDNQFQSYSDLKGAQITVIDFWATWCQPCIRSIPKLVELSDEYKDRGVQFIGISIDSPANISKVKPFARSMGIRYPILLDSSGELMGDLNVTSVPSLLIIGKDNRILYLHEGFSAGDEVTIREELEKQLDTIRN